MEKPDVEKPGEEENKSYDPFTITRSPYIFGGVINEWKKRVPLYVSDFKDGFDGQVISTALFIFFACLSGAIAFGGNFFSTKQLKNENYFQNIFRCTW